MRTHDIAALLPAVMARTATPGSVLDTMLAVMEDQHAPVEHVLATFDRYVDPQRCPREFVPFLAEWVGLAWLVEDATGGIPSTGDGPLRDVVARARDCAQLRGTREGLVLLLGLVTGLRPFEVTAVAPFHVLVTAPAAALPHRELVERVVAHEKPAGVVADVRFGDDPIAPVVARPATSVTPSTPATGEPSTPTPVTPPPLPPPPHGDRSTDDEEPARG